MLERERFNDESSPICVAIVGCGYSGVELAATISERLQNKGIVQAVNVETTICPTAPPGNREAALKVSSYLVKFNIEQYMINSHAWFVCSLCLCSILLLVDQFFIIQHD